MLFDLLLDRNGYTWEQGGEPLELAQHCPDHHSDRHHASPSGLYVDLLRTHGNNRMGGEGEERMRTWPWSWGSRVCLERWHLPGTAKHWLIFLPRKQITKRCFQDWVLSLTHSKFYKTVMFIFLPTKDTTTVTLFDKNFSCGIAVAVFPLETEWPATANNRATVLPYLFIFQVRLKPVPQIFGGLCVPGM